jgi:hypothetical protein
MTFDRSGPPLVHGAHNVKRLFVPTMAACGLLFSLAAHALTADEIIARHVEARGGLASLEALKSLKRSGRLVIPGANIELSASEVRVRPDKIRQEYTLQGMTAVQAWDGHEAWQIQPFEGRKDPERMPADEAKPLAVAADIDFPLVNYQAKGSKVEYLGLEEVDGTPAHKLRVELASGDDITYYIDPDTWMIIRDVQKRDVRGAEQVTETDYGDYEKVQGVWVPMTEASGPKGSNDSQKQQVVYDHAEGNGAVDAKAFSFPAAK